MVDAAERRESLVQAVWRVIRRAGVEGATVREVASEAGVSMGSLRHYFGSQTELLMFAMQMVVDRVEHRIAGLHAPEDPRAAAELVLSELLPLDEDRRAENEVWLAFTARALVDVDLRALRDDAYDRLRAGCERWVRALVPATAPDPLIAVETERLFALIDGLAVHAAMRPELATADRLVAVLSRHLDQLAALATLES